MLIVHALINDTTRAYASLRKLTAAFGQTLLALKIYSTRHVHYRFLSPIASAQTQSTYLNRAWTMSINVERW